MPIPTCLSHCNSRAVDYSRVHDQVTAIDPFNATVNFAPALQTIPLGKDDSFSSPVERLFLAINRPDGGCANPSGRV